MKVSIRGEKTKITPAMTSYATEKLGKLDKYVEKSEDIKPGKFKIEILESYE